MSPAFDINPNTEKATHVLNIDDRDNRPSLENALATFELYEMTRDRGIEVAKEVLQAISPWRSAARKLHIANADIHAMEPAFLSDEMEELLNSEPTSSKIHPL